MSEESAPAPPSPSHETRTRGRPRKGPENQQQRIERLQAELKEAQAAMKLAEDQRATIIGHACLRHARRNTEFSRQLAAALRAEVRSKSERAMIGDLLNEATA